MTSRKLVAVLALGSIACADKGRECARLLSTTQASLGALKQLAQSDSDTDNVGARALGEGAARQMRQELAALSQIKFRSQELREFSNRYQGMTQKLIAGFDELAVVAGEGERLASDARAEVSTIDAIGTAIIDNCERATKEAAACDRVAAILKSISKDDDAERHAEQVKALKAVTIKDTKLKKSVADLMAMLDRLADLIRRQAEMQKQNEAASQRITTASGERGALLDDIIQFCASR
jgi:hypothetical protein